MSTKGDPIRLRKKNVFVMEKYVEDVKQDEKHVPDLLEAIMKGSGLVKEESRQIWFIICSEGSNSDPKSQK